MSSDARKLAEDHWEYNEKLIRLLRPEMLEDDLNVLKYIYIEAMVHGWKHATENKNCYPYQIIKIDEVEYGKRR